MSRITPSVVRGRRCRRRTGGAHDLGDAPALDDETRVPRLDGDLVVHLRRLLAVLAAIPNVNHLGNDAAGRDDPVAPLHLTDSYLVLAPLLLLRSKDDHPEDQDDHREHEYRA